MGSQGGPAFGIRENVEKISRHFYQRQTFPRKRIGVETYPRRTGHLEVSFTGSGRALFYSVATTALEIVMTLPISQLGQQSHREVSNPQDSRTEDL